MRMWITNRQYFNRDDIPPIKAILRIQVYDGMMSVAECAADSNAQTVHILSAYKNKNDRSKVQQPLMESTDSPQPTAEPRDGGGASVENSIFHSAVNVKEFRRLDKAIFRRGVKTRRRRRHGGEETLRPLRGVTAFSPRRNRRRRRADKATNTFGRMCWEKC